jgi:hypothetical protein
VTAAREYSEEDLEKAFHRPCGEPISIDERIRENFERMRPIKALLDLVPRLQAGGYLVKT